MRSLAIQLPPRNFESFRCFDRRENRLPARWHQHPEIELTYVPAGPGDRLVGDHVGRYQDHDLVLVGENLPHNWASDEYRGSAIDMHEAVVLYFNREFLGSGFLDLPETGKLNELLDRAGRGLWFPPGISATVGQQMRELTTEWGIPRIAKLLLVLDQLCDCDEAQTLASESFHEKQSESCVRPNNKMDAAIQYISQHFTRADLRTNALAEFMNMNPSSFARSFRISTGRTPTSYINHLRLGHARRLLLEEAGSVLDACLASGFSSISHFNKLFKSEYAMTPSEFRDTHLMAHDSTRAR